MNEQLPLFSLALSISDLIDASPIALALVSPAIANIAKTVNLIIFLGALYFLLRKPMREFFRQRYTEIRASLERAAREKETASARLAEIDARLNKLDAEIADIRTQAEREAAAERERIETQARQEAEKLRAMAQREIESAKNSALAELQQFTATQAVELAEKIIRRELTPDDDARLVGRISHEIQQVSQAAK
ncbi:MAG TPA: ATP synthase F0 subunit B [Blastocatellia bacterium]|nr:ATP synthase F0 subunit B [Blastocatellia bacterium]